MTAYVDPFDDRSPFEMLEYGRRQRLLIAITTGGPYAIIPIILLFGFMLVREPSVQVAIAFVLTLGIIPILLFARRLARQDKTDLAGYLLLPYFLTTVGANGVLVEGLFPAIAPAYIVLVFMSGMFMTSRQNYMVAGLASIMWVAEWFLLERAVIVPVATLPSTAAVAVGLIVVVGTIFAAFIAQLGTRDLRRALSDATYELIRVNRRLEDTSAEAQRAKERVEAILDNSPDAILLLRGLDGAISVANRSTYEMFGFKIGTTLNRTLTSLVDTDYVSVLEKTLHQVATKQATISLEVHARRQDSTTFDAGIALAPITGGELVKGMVCTIRDISERVQAEEQIRTALTVKENALAEREVLLKEIHHRVKNNLQVVTSLLQLQSASLQDEEAKLYFLDSQNRVQSMALIHEQLYQAADLARIDFSTYIQNLTSHLLASYEGSTGKIDLNIQAEEVYLPIDAAIPCGLLINEMISNAFKHAFPSQGSGMITIMFQSNPEGGVDLTVRDNGVGFPADLDFTRTQTLGMQLIQQLTRQLHGTVELDRTNGTCFHVRFSLS